MNNKFIIGAGPVGLAAAFYLKDYSIIDEKPLGQLNTPFIPGPRLLQYSVNTYKFVNDVLKECDLKNVKAKIAIAKIGYEDDHFYSNIPNPHFISKYTKITRDKTEKEDSYLSEGKNTIKHIILDNINNEDSYIFIFKTLLKIIEKRGQLIKGTISKLDINSNFIGVKLQDQTSFTVKYEKIINTISLKILTKINKDIEAEIIKNNNIKNFDLTTIPKYFYKCEYNNIGDKLLKNAFNYIYSVSGKYTRKTYFNDYIVYETINKIDSNDIEGNKITNKAENLPLQIKNSMCINKATDDIIMLGRFAEWNHKVKINEALDKINLILNAR